MKNRKFIPKEINSNHIVECYKCKHENKCINAIVVTTDCGSFKQRAGIRK